jgi:hypothetical protein
MDTQRGTQEDGLRFVRCHADRITSWDGATWRAEYLSDGRWAAYPATAAADPTRGELYDEGRRVLAVLRGFAS